MKGQVTVIERSQGWRSRSFRELWTYRDLLWVLVGRDIKVRYKQTALGAAWALLQPVASMVLFSIVFGRFAGIPSDGVPYPLFVYAALLPWTFFANAVSNASDSLVGQQQLISKVYFPRLMLPLASIGAALLDFLIASVVMVGLMLFYGVTPGPQLFALLALLPCVCFIALGVGTLLAALTVTYRDFRYVVPFMLQFWMFATPVVYPASLFPENWRWLLYLNPMAGLVEGFRAAFLGTSFQALELSLSAAVGVLLFIFGSLQFERMERRFADVI